MIKLPFSFDKLMNAKFCHLIISSHKKGCCNFACKKLECNILHIKVNEILSTFKIYINIFIILRFLEDIFPKSSKAY